MTTATIPTPAVDRSARTSMRWRAGLACLATGRFDEALHCLRRGARGRDVSQWPAAALAECEALLGLGRGAEALAVSTGALRREGTDPDRAARLRILRGQALWSLGRVVPAQAEVRRAEAQAGSPLTKARALEVLARWTWEGRGDRLAARRMLGEALALYGRAGSDAGIARCLGVEALALAEEGRPAVALRVASRRIETASATTRLDVLAEALGDRGMLLASLGRWGLARTDLIRAVDLVKQVSTSWVRTEAVLALAHLDVAVGSLEAARKALDAVVSPDGDSGPRALAERLLLVSSLQLAHGEARRADAEASEAVRLFRVVGDLEGEARARLARSTALVAEGRSAEAVREARRVLRAAEPRSAEAAQAWVALGRALLRQPDANEALEAFERSREIVRPRTGLAALGRLGVSLASRGDREDSRVSAALEALEAWGDRRLLAAGLADIRCVRPEYEPPPAAPVPASSPGTGCSVTAAFADALDALDAPGEWPHRWAAAMEAAGPVLDWARAAWVGETGWLVRRGEGTPVSLSASDVARRIAGTGAPVLARLSDEPWRRDPSAIALGLGSAAAVPVGHGRALYVDRPVGSEPLCGRSLALLDRLGRAFAKHADACPPPEPLPAPAPFADILGRSPAMEALFAQMDPVADSDLAVHVFGETGTGKEAVARALHARSPRRDRPFVAVNASSLSDELFESEMFGHLKGAFTGAVAERRGHVMEAEGGTLFLDEVVDLSLKCQAKLLRLLSGGEFRRVGESLVRRARIRILTAANVRLAERVAAGAFREDLMYRLTGTTLRLPPLRERGDDVSLLVRHFLRTEAARRGAPPPHLPAEVLRTLSGHAWPGNVRQLEGEIGRLVVFAGRGAVRLEHLSPEIADPAPPRRGTLEDARSACEREVIGRALGLHRGNRTRSACALGITRQALIAKIRRYGL